MSKALKAGGPVAAPLVAPRAVLLKFGEKIVPRASLPKPKRSYTYRGLGDSRKSRKYQNARRRALQKLRERHPEEYESLFAEQLRRFRE